MRTIGILILSMIFSVAYSQKESSNFQLGGYIKYLNIPTKFRSLPLSTSQFVHHRLNTKYFVNDNWSLTVEARNRIFYGENVKMNPRFGQEIDQYDGLIDLSILWISNRSAVVHTQIDRAYVRWTSEKWEITVGRQRINWGKNLVWNPNDIFNALNYLDFDYEERPGSDALRIQYYTGLLSHIELAVSPHENIQETIAAGLYKFNWKNYDIQVLGGYSNRDLVGGVGFSGYVGGAGLKGEATYFSPIPSLSDQPASLSLSLTGDYQFSNSIYVAASFLYNENASDDLGLIGNNISTSSGEPLSAKNLFPSRWAFFTQTSYQPHPLVRINAAVIYGAQDNLTLFLPSVSYSIQENWDIDLTVQSFSLTQQ